MLWTIVYYAAIYFFIVIPLHELGHIITYWVCTGKFPKNLVLSLRGIEVTLGDIGEGEESAVLIIGIMAGAVPLLFLPAYMGWVLALPYFVIGCGYDIGRLGKISKNINIKKICEDIEE